MLRGGEQMEEKSSNGFPSRKEHCPLSREKTLEAQKRITKRSLRADAERFAILR